MATVSGATIHSAVHDQTLLQQAVGLLGTQGVGNATLAASSGNDTVGLTVDSHLQSSVAGAPLIGTASAGSDTIVGGSAQTATLCGVAGIGFDTPGGQAASDFGGAATVDGANAAVPLAPTVEGAAGPISVNLQDGTHITLIGFHQ